MSPRLRKLGFLGTWYVEIDCQTSYALIMTAHFRVFGRPIRWHIFERKPVLTCMTMDAMNDSRLQKRSTLMQQTEEKTAISSQHLHLSKQTLHFPPTSKLNSASPKCSLVPWPRQSDLYHLIITIRNLIYLQQQLPPALPSINPFSSTTHGPC